MKKPRVAKKVLKMLTGVIIGSAVGSILGLTLAPREGKEARKLIKDHSMKIYLAGKEVIGKKEKMPFWKRAIVKLLTRKK